MRLREMMVWGNSLSQGTILKLEPMLPLCMVTTRRLVVTRLFVCGVASLP